MSAQPFQFNPFPQTSPQPPLSIGSLLGGLGDAGAILGSQATSRGPSEAQGQSQNPAPGAPPSPQMDPMALLKAILGGATGAGGVVDPNLSAILQSRKAEHPDPHDVRSWQDRAGSWGSANFTPQGQWDAQTQQHSSQPMHPTVGNYLANQPPPGQLSGVGSVGAAAGNPPLAQPAGQFSGAGGVGAALPHVGRLLLGSLLAPGAMSGAGAGARGGRPGMFGDIGAGSGLGNVGQSFASY